jgi:hypothetical protein
MMFDSRVQKQIVGEYVGESRSSGKPKNGWEDELLKGAAKLLNTKNWRTAVTHRGYGRRKTEQERRKRKKEKNGTNKKCFSFSQHFTPIFLFPSD